MKRKKIQNYSYLILLFAVLLLIIILLAVSSPYFFSWKNCRNILNQSAIYLILSVGMTFVISMGEIDLSVGATMGFTGMCMGLLSQHEISALGIIIISLLVSALIGCVNGVITAYGKINSFIVTLSIMTILRAVILIVTNSKSIFGFGPVFNYIGTGRVGPVNVPILISLVAAGLGAIILHKTVFGNYCLFCGTNEIALNRSGVNVKRVKILTFTICGFCAGLAGLIMTARLNSAEPLAGQGYEMDAIAATILGGTSMRGGKGSVAGTIIACFILNVLKNGLTLLAISSHYQEVLTGMILIVSVLISESKERKKSEV